jgi:hypothetical protein
VVDPRKRKVVPDPESGGKYTLDLLYRQAERSGVRRIWHLASDIPNPASASAATGRHDPETP